MNKRKQNKSHSSSVTRLGEFWKFWVIFLTKVAQIIGNVLGYFVKPHSYVKTVVATFWATFGNIWATFYSNNWSHCSDSSISTSFLLESHWKPIKSDDNTSWGSAIEQSHKQVAVIIYSNCATYLESLITELSKLEQLTQTHKGQIVLILGIIEHITYRPIELYLYTCTLCLNSVVTIVNALAMLNLSSGIKLPVEASQFTITFERLAKYGAVF